MLVSTQSTFVHFRASFTSVNFSTIFPEIEIKTSVDLIICSSVNKNKCMQFNFSYEICRYVLLNIYPNTLANS